MYAIVEIAGQQFKVSKDLKVYVHRLTNEEGSKVSFDKVLLLDDNGNITLGAPAIEGASVEAKVLQHLKGDKVIVFKKKRRKGFKKRNGHRQYLTQIVIEGISATGGKKATPKAEKAAPKTDKVAETKTAATGDRASVNFGEDHELNYHLKKNNLSQSKDNREVLIALGKEVKAELGKNILSHEDVDAAIEKNIARFNETKK
jgi:large subunit ribosomal protein L21